MEIATTTTMTTMTMPTMSRCCFIMSIVFYASNLYRKSTTAATSQTMGMARSTCEVPLFRCGTWGYSRVVTSRVETPRPFCRIICATSLSAFLKARARCSFHDCYGVATSCCFLSTVWAYPGGGPSPLRHAPMASVDAVSPKSVACLLAPGSSPGDRDRDFSCIMRLMGSLEFATSALGTWAGPVLAFARRR